MILMWHLIVRFRTAKMKLLTVVGMILSLSAVSMQPEPPLSDSADRYLTLPILEKCNHRFKEASYNNRNFFYSGNDPELKDAKYDWLDARNTCRERCMETISFETQEKFDFFKTYIEQQKIPFVWTSGRICDFAGCEGRWDLLPKRIKGWLWSASQVAIAPTNKIPPGWNYQPWSRTGLKKKPQPDNAEFYISQTSEACLGILNNMYNDSVAWHDIACYQKTRFICEDSELLLKEVLEKKDDPAEDDAQTNAEVVPRSTKASTTTTTTKKPESSNEKTERRIEPVDSATQPRRRKLVRKKLPQENDSDKTNNETLEENTETSSTTMATTSTVAPTSTAAVTENVELVDGNEKFDATDDEVRVEEETEVEEVETTTITEAPDTTRRPSRGRGRQRRPLN